MVRRISLAIIAAVFAVALFPLLAFAQAAAAPAQPSLWQQLAPAVITLALAFVALIVLAVKLGLPAYIKAHTEKGLVQSSLLTLASLAAAVVTAAEQTGGSELRKAFADGKLTKEELAAGLAALAESCKQAVFDATVGRLTSALGWTTDQVSAAVDAHVEAAVPAAKALVAASKAPAAAPANP